MANVTLEEIHKDLKDIKGELKFLKHVIGEEFELSEHAKKDLAEARKTPKEEHISQENIEKEFLK